MGIVIRVYIVFMLKFIFNYKNILIGLLRLEGRFFVNYMIICYWRYKIEIRYIFLVYYLVVISIGCLLGLVIFRGCLYVKNIIISRNLISLIF